MLLTIGLYFLILPLVTYLLIILSFIFGWHITPLQLILATALSLVIVNYKVSKARIVGNVVIILLIQVFSLFLAAILFDPSHDGQVYHAVIIKLLVQGWNPFYHPIISVAELPYNIDPEITLWCSHYAKGVETIEAGIVCLTQNLESGKVFNFWMYLSLGILSREFLTNIITISSPIIKNAISLIVIANPVVINQLFTFYIDYFNYSFICLGIISYAFTVYKNTTLFKLALGLICFFIPAIKFNIAFWFVIILFATSFYIYFISKKFTFKPILKYALFFAAGLLIGAYNPYVTNLMLKGNLFYPLDGNGKLDVITANIPLSIVNGNRFIQINKSLISNPNNEYVHFSNSSNPLIIDKQSLLDSGIWDVRLGGYGIFFFEALIILLIIFFSLPKNKDWIVNVCALLYLYLILLILPGGFWARYTPFFYLSVCVLTVYNACKATWKWQKTLNILAIALLLSDGVIAFGRAFYLTGANTIKTEYFISKINKTSKDSIEVVASSATLMDKIEKTNKYIIFNKSLPDSSLVKISLYPTPYIQAFPELYDQSDRYWILKKIGYNNFIDQTEP